MPSATSKQAVRTYKINDRFKDFQWKPFDSSLESTY
jgi:hypothetical protein